MNKMSTSYQTELWGCEAHNTHDGIPERLERLESSVMVAEKPMYGFRGWTKISAETRQSKAGSVGRPRTNSRNSHFVTICMANCSWA